MKRWLIAILVLLLAISGCSLTGASTADPNTIQVEITKHSFKPIVVYINQGQTVQWTNKDANQHTVTLLGTFDSGTLGRRHKFSYTFNEPGSYQYTDLFDDTRTGKVIVK